MADNYLEKKMDDYRRGNNNSLPRRRSSFSSGNLPALPIVAHRIALIVENQSLLEALLAAFQQIGGLKTAFVGADYRQGNLLAQTRGALFVRIPAFSPEASTQLFAETATRWGGVDAIISDKVNCLTETIERQIFIDTTTIDHQCLVSLDIDDCQALTDTDVSNLRISRIIASPVCDAASIAHAAIMLLTAPTSFSTTITLTP